MVGEGITSGRLIGSATPSEIRGQHPMLRRQPGGYRIPPATIGTQAMKTQNSVTCSWPFGQLEGNIVAPYLAYPWLLHTHALYVPTEVLMPMVCRHSIAHALGRGMGISRMAYLDKTYKNVTQGTFLLAIVSPPVQRYGPRSVKFFSNALYSRYSESFFAFAT